MKQIFAQITQIDNFIGGDEFYKNLILVRTSECNPKEHHNNTFNEKVVPNGIWPALLYNSWEDLMDAFNQTELNIAGFKSNMTKGKLLLLYGILKKQGFTCDSHWLAYLIGKRDDVHNLLVSTPRNRTGQTKVDGISSFDFFKHDFTVYKEWTPFTSAVNLVLNRIASSCGGKKLGLPSRIRATTFSNVEHSPLYEKKRADLTTTGLFHSLSPSMSGMSQFSVRCHNLY